MDGQKYGWTGKKNEGAKSSKTIDIASYALKVSVNGVICVFVANLKVCKLARQCPPKHV